MPSLAELTDQSPQQDNSLPVEQPYRGANLGPLQGSNPGIVGNTTAIVPAAPDTVAQPDPNTVGSSGSQIIDKLLGLGGQERYQLWPEKVVRDAISAPHDIIQANPYPEGSEENSWFEDQRAKSLVPAALNMSALAGTGGLAGTGAEVGEALGAGPFLRPALKVGDKIYKAPIKDAENPLGFGAEHSDALPAHLADDFYKKAMSGEDINHYNFGFVNHKGQFLDRGKALDYGIEQGLVDPQNGKYGVLTSTMLADSSKPGTAIEAMAKTNQPFYSALEHNVNAIQQPKMTGDQWLGTLSNKPGVKPEELDWTGTKEFLQSKGKEPVTKAELQEHLQNNKVELKEVDKGGDSTKEQAFALAKEHGWKSWDDIDAATQAKYLARVSKEAGDNPTKYHSYQLPGGENYREKLLTLPDKSPKLELDKVSQMVHQKNYEELTKSQQENIERLAMVGDRARDTTYKSSHWDEPNILAHVRMNDRMIDGKKSLHLEEIQSDWHQQGRDKGYALSPKEKARVDEIIAQSDKVGGVQNLPKEIQDEAKQLGMRLTNRSVPNAPFKKSWHELALKRMIREAAEKGYDRLSWTPGEAQAARYDLSKDVSKVYLNNPVWHGENDIRGNLIVTGKNGNDLISKPVKSLSEIKDLIGKEAADNLVNKPTSMQGRDHVLSGEGLKVGGEGMKGFYDSIVPKAVEKISGEKVKTAQLAGKLSNKMGQPPEMQPVHYIDISPALRDKALGKGFPLFSSTHIFTPVSHNPFEEKKKK